MELSLYGVSSIRLDMMKKRSLISFFAFCAAMYITTLAVAAFFPPALIELDYGGQLGNESRLTFEGCSKFEASDSNYLQLMVKLDVDAQSKTKLDTLSIRYQVSFFST